MTEYKTTDEHFEIFRDEVAAHCSNLGLTDWHLEVFHKDTNGSRASCITSLEDMVANITLDPTWDVEPTEQSLRETAFHESCELLLAPLHHLSHRRTVTDWEIESARHAIINRLHNAFFEPLAIEYEDEKDQDPIS